MNIRKKLYESLVRKYDSEILEAENGLMAYMENSVGIHENQQHNIEMDKFVDGIARASDKLKTLQIFFKSTYGNQEE